MQMTTERDTPREDVYKRQSSTGSSHSFSVCSPGTSTARCENQLSFAAPCQCLTPAGIVTASPGRSACAGFPHS